MPHKVNSHHSQVTIYNEEMHINLEYQGVELEFEFDTFVSANPRFFEELEKLGVRFEKERRYCG